MHEFVVGNCVSGKTRYASEVLTARVEHGHYPVLVSRYPREWNGMGTSSLEQVSSEWEYLERTCRRLGGEFFSPHIVIVDGVSQISSADDRRRLERLLREGRQAGLSVLVTATFIDAFSSQTLGLFDQIVLTGYTDIAVHEHLDCGNTLGLNPDDLRVELYRYDKVFVQGGRIVHPQEFDYARKFLGTAASIF